MLVFIPAESDSARRSAGRRQSPRFLPQSARLRRRNVALKLETISADFKSVIPRASHPGKDEYGNDQN
jgi:hypothetical protein